MPPPVDPSFRAAVRSGLVWLAGLRPWLAFAALSALLLWPAPGVGAGTANYTVRKGEHLSGIATEFGVTLRDLKAANRLDSGHVQPGQRLLIPEPLRLVKTIHWRRPLKHPGRVLRGFRPRPVGRTAPHTGADVAAAAGSPVLCPANGVVRYCGDQDGFGTVVIIEHGAGYSTVLAPVDPDSALCRAGEAVRRGDVLGRTAAPVENAVPSLHVELRRDLQPVSPQRLLR